MRKILKLIIVLCCFTFVYSLSSCYNNSNFDVVNCDDVYSYDRDVKLGFIIFSKDNNVDYNKIELVSVNDNYEVSNYNILFAQTSCYTYSYANIEVTYNPKSSEDAITKLNFLVNGKTKVEKYIDRVSFISDSNYNEDYIYKFNPNQHYLNGKAELKLTTEHGNISNISVKTYNKASCETSFYKSDDAYYICINYDYDDSIHYFYGFKIHLDFENGDICEYVVITTPNNSSNIGDLVYNTINKK